MGASIPAPDRPSIHDKARFGEALIRAMDKAEMTGTELAKQSGLSYNSIKGYRMAHKFPLPQSAEVLAEALDAPVLRQIARIEIQCIVCRKAYIVGSQKPRTVCSDACYKTAYSRANHKKHKRNRKNALSRANREIKRHREAVRLHCLSCTGGETICPMADCELRPVSPLPLRKVNHVEPKKRAVSIVSRVRTNPDIGMALIRRDGSNRSR